MTIMEKKEFITNLGISFDEFGVNTIRVYEHPTYFREGYEEESLRRVFDLIVSIDKDFDRVKFNEQLAINLSCKMSVKANTFIGSLEQETLLKGYLSVSFLILVLMEDQLLLNILSMNLKSYLRELMDRCV